jgi:drug/metabolite transporter (DMT)-like permease
LSNAAAARANPVLYASLELSAHHPANLGSVCLVALAAVAMVFGVRLWPQPGREWLVFAGLALGPMLLGHTGFNWALRYRPAYAVSVTILAEPLGASLLAAVLPWIRDNPHPTPKPTARTSDSDE